MTHGFICCQFCYVYVFLPAISISIRMFYMALPGTWYCDCLSGSASSRVYRGFELDRFGFNRPVEATYDAD